MEKALLLSHVAAGLLVFFSGFINLLNPKGQKQHIVIGKIDVAGMTWVFLSAILVISFYRFSFFLLVIGVLSFYSTFTGYRVLKRKVPGDEKWYDWLASILTALFGIGLTSYGCWALYITSFTHYLGYLSLGFGVFTFLNGAKDLRFFIRQPKKEKLWWLHQHIGAMGGSYIAAVTAAAVQNGNLFLAADSSIKWLPWVLPTVIGSPMISVFKRRYFKRAA